METNANITKGKRKLTQLERELRNSAIKGWAEFGITISSIAAIFQMDHSTVSRIVSGDSE
jgi:hypothetical protein